jgi:hypothetical protein
MSDRQPDRIPDEQIPSDRVPPELDPWFERYDDDDRPPRTMARRFRPLILGAAALTLVAMVLLVTQAL